MVPTAAQGHPHDHGQLSLNYTTEKYNLFLSADGGVRSRGHIGHAFRERLRNDSVWSRDTIDQYSMRRNYMGSMKVGGEYYFNEKNSLLVSYQLRGGNRHRWTSHIFSTDLLYSGPFLDYLQIDTNNNRNINHVFNPELYQEVRREGPRIDGRCHLLRHASKGNGWQEQTLPRHPGWPMTATPCGTTTTCARPRLENHHKALNIKVNYVHPFAEKWKLETGYEGRLDWPDQNAVYYRTEYDRRTTAIRYYDSISSTHFNYTQQTHGHLRHRWRQIHRQAFRPGWSARVEYPISRAMT